MDLDWAFALKDGVPQITRQSLIPGGSVEVSHENLFGDSQSLSVSLSASDWRNPAADLGFQMSYTEPFYKPNTTRNLQVGGGGWEREARGAGGRRGGGAKAVWRGGARPLIAPVAPASGGAAPRRSSHPGALHSQAPLAPSLSP